MGSDRDTFRIEVQTVSPSGAILTTQFSDCGARNFVRKLRFEAPFITSIVWLECDPYEPEATPIDHQRAEAA